MDKLQLCFINISANKDLHMDYNFRNDIGRITISVEKKLSEKDFKIFYSDIEMIRDDSDEENDNNVVS